MPTEVGLAHDYNVSSGTVRKAIEELDDRGLVDRRQGRGTYVRDPQDVPLKVALSREQATALLDVFTAAAPKNGLEPVPLCLVNFELALTEYVHGPVTKVVTAKVKPSTKTSK
jgi:DNA-binding transcriptional MocR family regulator